MMINLIYYSYSSSYFLSSKYNIKPNPYYSNDIILEIKKINLKQKVIKADDDFSNLDNHLVYYKSFNPLNKVIIFGHSGLGYGAFFNRLDELKIGNKAFVYNKEKCYEYSIYDIKIVDEDAIYLLDDEENSHKLYLITCDKKRKNKRLVLYLKLNNIKSIEK